MTAQPTAAVEANAAAPAQGDLTISEPQTVSSQVDGNVTVTKGGVLILYGQVVGDLTVEPGGQAQVYGQVAGDLINLGGTVTVYGMVQGELVDNGGETEAVSGAFVNGAFVP